VALTSGRNERILYRSLVLFHDDKLVYCYPIHPTEPPTTTTIMAGERQGPPTMYKQMQKCPFHIDAASQPCETKMSNMQ